MVRHSARSLLLTSLRRLHQDFTSENTFRCPVTNFLGDSFAHRNSSKLARGKLLDHPIVHITVITLGVTVIFFRLCLYERSATSQTLRDLLHSTAVYGPQNGPPFRFPQRPPSSTRTFDNKHERLRINDFTHQRPRMTTGPPRNLKTTHSQTHMYSHSLNDLLHPLVYLRCTSGPSECTKTRRDSRLT